MNRNTNKSILIKIIFSKKKNVELFYENIIIVSFKIELHGDNVKSTQFPTIYPKFTNIIHLKERKVTKIIRFMTKQQMFRGQILLKP